MPEKDPISSAAAVTGRVRILGIDPGSRQTGWGLIDRFGSRLAPVAHGLIRCRGQALAPRLGQLSQDLQAVIRDHRPDVGVLESPFHGRNSLSLIVLAQARGALIAALALESVEVGEVAPAAVKRALTGNGRADKSQVAHMVRLVLGLKQDRLAADTTDALAVAICYAQRLRFDRLEAARRGRRMGYPAEA